MSNRNKKIKSVIENKGKILTLKKALRKECDSGIITPKIVKPSDFQSKDLQPDTDDIIYRTIIANTYLFLDSHDDVHAPNIFSKSIAENKNQLYQKDHSLSIDKIAGKVLRAYEKTGSFKDFGFDSDKETQALLKDVEIRRDIDPKFFMMMHNQQIKQHSVGMQYIKLELAADDVNYEEEFKLYQEWLPRIGNFEKVEEQGYFWFIKEAREFETSAVTMGSNPITGVYEDNQASKELDKIVRSVGGLEKFKDFYKEFIGNHSEELAAPSTKEEEPKEGKKANRIYFI